MLSQLCLKWAEKHLGSNQLVLQHICHVFLLVLYSFTMVRMWHSRAEEIQGIGHLFLKKSLGHGKSFVFEIRSYIFKCLTNLARYVTVMKHKNLNNQHYAISNWSRRHWPFILHFSEGFLKQKGKSEKEEATLRCLSSLKSQTLRSRWQMENRKILRKNRTV